MKRIFLLLTCLVFIIGTNAQTTVCNANFSWNTSGLTAKFLPEINSDANGIHHYWTFGDASGGVTTVSPYHTFPAAGGTFLVTHILIVYNPNNVQVCKDSVSKEIYIPADCVAPNFTYLLDYTNFRTVKFTNTTTGILSTDSIAWMFGDGSTSNDANPTHTYNNAGIYHVCLLIKKRNTNAPCVREKCFDVVVTRPCDMQVYFSWQKDPINTGKVYFVNQTLNFSSADSTKWDFGDGTTSTSPNPDHIYTSPGKYNVCLWVKRNDNVPGTAVCSATYCKEIEIGTTNCTFTPDFTFRNDSAIGNPYKYYFENTTPEITAYDSVKWTFGDGTQSYHNEKNPDHTYTATGTYNVCMIIIKRNPNLQPIGCAKYICKTITIIKPCDFVINFTATASTDNKRKVNFIATSSLPIGTTGEVGWTFGDGSAVATGWTTAHEYLLPGKYEVCLRVQSGPNCIKYKCDSVIVQENTTPCEYVSSYTWAASTDNKKKINFTNTTTLITANAYAIATWSFGDGTANVTSWNATHEYAQPGKYYVCLRVQYSNTCVKYKCDSITVLDNPAPCDFAVGYTATASSDNKKKITFTANSNLPSGTAAEVIWSFGDNTTATGWTIAHEYAQSGKYYVCVRIQTGPNCVKYKCDSITVLDNPVPCDFVANYTWVADQTNTKKIYFTNTTLTPTPNAIVKWTFGDGTDASSWNAIHEYAQPGKYYVCLKVQYGTSTNCVKYKCDSITVIVPPTTDCKQLSSFTYTPTSVAGIYAFTPVHQSNDVQYTWTFGDGKGSHDMISTHPFNPYGAYQVCLTVFKNTNCASTTCKEVRVSPPANCDSVKVAYQYYKDQYMSNKIHFYAYSNTTIQQQVWTILKRGATTPITITQNNPIYDFADTGYYYVCLKVTTNGGCIKEYCSVIHIETITNFCQLETYPNPAISQISLYVQQPTAETIHAYVYDAVNNMVTEKHQSGIAGSNTLIINVSTLPAGFYTVKLIYGNRVCFAKFQKI
ncbi:PKD domain-containing protein [Ferruginibacter sp. SUN002]|uniref:PKD domain-containing protein n=1 Tax=Ferruginibacter sp. SUN002 TaxID=2937789 RepID=UPI003D35CF90